MFLDGNVDGARSVLAGNPELAHHDGYASHPLLTEFVKRNNGHCYRQAHLEIADLLIPENIRSFRDAILRDEFQDVRQLLNSNNELVHAEFTAGRGIAQAIHHWISVAIGEYLLNAGADIEARTTLGESPLSLQLRFGTVESVKFLLKHGANPNNAVRFHMPTESMAELITLMLDHGWDINNGQMLRDAIRALAAAGADVDARDNAGRMPLDLARDANRHTARDELMALKHE